MQCCLFTLLIASELLRFPTEAGTAVLWDNCKPKHGTALFSDHSTHGRGTPIDVLVGTAKDMLEPDPCSLHEACEERAWRKRERNVLSCCIKPEGPAWQNDLWNWWFSLAISDLRELAIVFGCLNLLFCPQGEPPLHVNKANGVMIMIVVQCSGDCVPLFWDVKCCKYLKLFKKSSQVRCFCTTPVRLRWTSPNCKWKIYHTFSCQLSESKVWIVDRPFTRSETKWMRWAWSMENWFSVEVWVVEELLRQAVEEAALRRSGYAKAAANAGECW